MKTIIAIAALVAIASSAFATPTASADATASVTVRHGINGTSAGARLFGDPSALPRELPVTVNIADGAIVIEDFTFGESAVAQVPAGTYDVKVSVGSLKVIDQDLTLNAGDEVTATARLLGTTPQIVVTSND